MLSSWIKAAAHVGVPAVIALALVWFMISRVEQDLREIKTAASQASSRADVAAQQGGITQSSVLDLHRVLRQICVNTAGNDRSARNECLR